MRSSHPGMYCTETWNDESVTTVGSDEDNLPDEPGESQLDEFSRVFGARFDHLMRTIPSPSGALWTNALFADVLTERGLTTSRNYVAQLRAGRRVNPSSRLVAAIADILAVDVAYFFDDKYAAALDEDLELLSAIRKAGMAGIALRASDLSPTGIREIAQIIEAVRRIEGLPPDQPTD